MDLNVLGKKLIECSCDPMTGWFRDGKCRTDHADHGLHTICCQLTDEFLQYSKEQGNDLITPNLKFGFKGLTSADHWCVCAGRWLDAHKAGKACPVILESTHEETLAVIPLRILKDYAKVKES